jgi:hypothetical protein
MFVADDSVSWEELCPLLLEHASYPITKGNSTYLNSRYSLSLYAMRIAYSQGQNPLQDSISRFF